MDDAQKVRVYEAALSNIAGVLGPLSVCTCHAPDCGLEIESSEALRYARVALGLEPEVQLLPRKENG
jgi:hypothetical protein